jgi:1-acyl-sn-glycerol-3-phosphate acyltransferase
VLDDRDPDLVRSALPRLWLAASLWFRSEVRGMGNVPDRGPVLLLGNRSGGSLSPDTVVFALAFSTYFGVERRFHQLVTGLPLTAPAVGLLRGFGILEPTPDNLRAALASGAATLVYPGGPREGRRPTWRSAQLQLGDDRDAIAAALEAGVPIVPLVSIGGQETALFLGARLGAIPAPPLPAKITIEVLPPIDPVALFGPDPDPEDVHRHIEVLMAETLELLAAERRWPVLG